MSSQFRWPTPEWQANLPPEEQEKARVRVLLDLASIYATPKGTAIALAAKIGCGRATILQARARGTVSAELAIKIEQLLGRPEFSRELFRPDLFLIRS